VLLPLNFVQYADPVFRRNAKMLLHLCRERDVGVMIIKSIARGGWGERPKVYNTRYEPFEDVSQMQAVRFALSQDVTGLCTAAEITLLPAFLEACERFAPMGADEQEELVESAVDLEPFFG
jgi:hypothetical protein